MSQNESQYENMMCAAECVAEAIRESVTAVVAAMFMMGAEGEPNREKAVIEARALVKAARKS